MLHPHTDIALEELPSPVIAQAIAEQAADIGIVADHADLRGLTSYPFRQDRLVLALPPGHALSGRRTVSFADTLSFEFIGLPEKRAATAFGAAGDTQRRPDAATGARR